VDLTKHSLVLLIQSSCSSNADESLFFSLLISETLTNGLEAVVKAVQLPGAYNSVLFVEQDAIGRPGLSRNIFG
jgi:hypothetical protein